MYMYPYPDTAVVGLEVLYVENGEYFDGVNDAGWVDEEPFDGVNAADRFDEESFDGVNDAA
jgi:hypothetical protein